MGQKIISDLQLISSVQNTTMLPVDNGIQSYRATALQLKSYILANGAIATAMIADEAVTAAKLAAAVAAALVPSGTILAFGGTSAPTGYLLCNGTAVSRSTYSTLFSAIGTAFGYGDNSTTFNVPDLRGRFLRGVDGGTGRDPNAAIRGAMNTGGSTGDNVGSTQSDAMQGHVHSYVKGNTDGSGASNGVMGANYGGGTATLSGAILTPITDGSNGTPRWSPETRPTNANVTYIIKI